MAGYSSDSSDSDNPVTSKTLDYSYLMLDSRTLEYNLDLFVNTDKKTENIETLLLYHNQLTSVPLNVKRFANLRVLDLSANRLLQLPETLCECRLSSLIAKNNALDEDSFPKTFGNISTLKELNVSGNNLSRLPEQIVELTGLKYLYAGGNRITDIPKEINKLKSLQVLSMGGNRLTDVPASVGELHLLYALVLCDNLLECLPSTIANLKNLKSLLLHKNRLRTLPPEIVALKCLTELSLRDNPLVVRFVRDMTYDPPTLLELAARVVKIHNVPYELEELPVNLVEYLSSAHHCVNPKCEGVYFDNRVEHIKFVDFCGKYRIPLLQYLCSSECGNRYSDPDSDSSSDSMVKKVLLG